PRSLGDAKTWAYVIQDQTIGDKIDRLAEGAFDVVVIDDPATIAESERYDAAADVAKIKARDKIVLAYVDVGEAEQYRTYYQSGWMPGNPSWIVYDDPDGWQGNYPVAFWV